MASLAAVDDTESKLSIKVKWGKEMMELRFEDGTSATVAEMKAELEREQGGPCEDEAAQSVQATALCYPGAVHVQEW